MGRGTPKVAEQSPRIFINTKTTLYEEIIILYRYDPDGYVVDGQARRPDGGCPCGAELRRHAGQDRRQHSEDCLHPPDAQ